MKPDKQNHPLYRQQSTLLLVGMATVTVGVNMAPLVIYEVHGHVPEFLAAITPLSMVAGMTGAGVFVLSAFYLLLKSKPMWPLWTSFSISLLGLLVWARLIAVAIKGI